MREIPGSPGVLTLGSVWGSHLYSARGTYTATVTVSDGHGGIGRGTFTVTVTAAPGDLGCYPTTTTITSIVNDTNGSTSNSATTADQNLVIQGTSAPNTVVTISRGDLGVIGTTSSDENGNWAFNYTGTTLANGTYQFTASAQPLGSLGVAGDLNAFVFTTTQISNTSFQGGVAVGGNVSKFNNDSVGTYLSNSNGTRDDLIVGGSLTTNNSNVPEGNVVYGGTLSANSLSVPNGSVRKDSVLNFAAAENYFTTASANWASEAVNGTVSGTGTSSLTFTGSNSAVNVFSIDAGNFNNTLRSIAIAAPANSLVLINVTNASGNNPSVSLSNVTTTMTGVDEHDVLWNFTSQVTQVTLKNLNAKGQGSPFLGSLLAPAAEVDFDNITFDGTVVANALDGSNGGTANYDPLVISCPPVVSAPYTVTVDTTQTPNPATTPKFFVSDATQLALDLYNSSGGSLGTFPLNAYDTAPSGVAANASGTIEWVVDANDNVFEYSSSGFLLGRWSMTGVTTPQDIATDGTNIWILDSGSPHKIEYFAGGANFTSGSHQPTSSFPLWTQSVPGGANGDSDPRGLTERNGTLWVSDVSLHVGKVFVYSTSGTYDGEWELDTADTDPTGITVNPTAGTDLWTVDGNTLNVYDYSLGSTYTQGSYGASSTFQLAAGNTNPTGVADPGPGGTSYTWVGTYSQDWSDQRNWSPTGVPSTEDAATIPAGDTVVIDDNSNTYSIYSLAVNGTLVLGDSTNGQTPTLSIATASTVSGTLQMYGVTLTGAGNITVSGTGSTFDWYDGKITGTGQLIIGSSGTLDIVKGSLASKNFIDRYLDRSLSNSGTIIFNESKGVYVTSNGVITNQSGAAIDFEAADGLYPYSGTSNGSLTNAGTINVTPSATTTAALQTPLTNQSTGTLNVQSGTLAATAAISNQGTVTISSGATLSDTNAAYSQGSGGTTTVTGTLSSNQMVSLTGGTLAGTGTVSANVSNAANVQPGNAAGTSPGILTVSGNYTQTSAGTLTADVAGTTAGTGYSQLAVSGAVSLAGNLTMNINYTNHVNDAYELINDTATSAEGGGFSGKLQGSTFTIGPAVYSVTYVGGTGNDFVVTTQSLPDTWVGGASGSWSTASNWSKGTVPSSSDDVVINSGSSVTISTGTLSIHSLTLGGTLELQSGTSLTLANASTVSGTLQVDPGASLSLAAATSVSGTLLMEGTTLQNTASLTVSGTFDWYDGKITGSGSTTIASGGALNIADGSISSPVGRVLDQPLTNSGTITWTANRSTTSTANGAITNQSAGLVSISRHTGGLAVAGTAPTFSNNGTINFTDVGNSFAFALPLTNAGTLSVQAGTLASTAAITNSGTVTILGGATLSDTGAAYTQTGGTTTVTGTLSSNQTVSLSGGTLTGTGTVGANLSNTAASVVPGNTLGTLTVSGNYTQASNGTLSIKLAGTVAGTSYSQLVVTGTASVAGALALTLSYTPQAGDSYEIINAASLSGTFTALPEGGDTHSGQYVFSNSYQGGTGSDDVLSYVANGVMWTSPSSGDWNVTGDWSSVPGTSSIVYIPSGITVTIDSSNYSINSMTVAGSLVVNAETLTIAAASTIYGNLTLEGSGGTIANSGNLTVSGSSGVLDWYQGGSPATTIGGSGELIVGTGSTLAVIGTGGLFSSGSRTLNEQVLNSGTIDFESTYATSVTSSGVITNESGGTVTFSNRGNITASGTAPTFTNVGLLNVTEGTNSVNFALPLANSGTFSVQTGTFTSSAAITNSGTVSISNGATLADSGATFSQSAGTTTVSGTLNSTQTVSVGGGTLLGTGTIGASLSNSGTVIPGSSVSSPGVLTVSGSYTQTSSGTLDVDLAGATPGTAGYSQLSVAGNVSLAGSLSPTLNYAPQSGNALAVVSEGGSTFPGTFSNVSQNSLLVLGTSGFYATYQAGSGLTLTAAAHPVITWTGGSSGDWNTAGNWQGGAVPNSSDDVIVGSGSTVTISSGSTSIDALISVAGTLQISPGASLTLAAASSVAGTLIMEGSTLQNAVGLTVTGTLDWYDGTITGAGSTSISSSGSLVIGDGSISSPVGRVLDQALSNSGTLSWTASRSTTATANGALNNQSANFTVTGSGGLSASGTAPTFTNSGTISLNAGGATFPLALPVTNSGTLSVTSGTLAATASITSTGSVMIGSGATLSDTGAAFSQSSGQLTVNGTLSSSQTVNINGGSLSGTGTVAANLTSGGTVAPGTSSSSPGILTISGNYTQNSGGTLSVILDGATAGTGYGQLAVAGTASLAGGLSLSLNYTPQAGDSYQIISAGSLSGAFNGVPQGGTVVAGLDVFSNSYQGGTGTDDVLSFLPNTVEWTSSTAGDWNTPADWSTHSLPTSSQTVIIPSGDSVTIDTSNYSIQSLILAGSLTINAETLTVASASSVTGSLTLEGSGGTLSDAGTMTVSGNGSTFNWYPGTTITGIGELSIGTSASLYVLGTGHGFDYGGNGGTRTLDQALVNAGNIYFQSTYATSFTANGIVTNEQAGTITFQNTDAINPSATPPTFTNSGTIDVAEGTKSVTFALPLANSGTLNVQSGTFAATAAVANSGTLNVQSGTFAATAAVANSGTVSISSGATLSDTGAAYTQSAGTTNLTGTLSSNQTVSLTGGTLAGTGTIAASLLNSSATVSPGASGSPGILTVSGSYDQSGGSLSIDFAGTTPGSGYSQLVVAGNVALAGTLSGALNYTPTTGQNLTVLSEGSSSSLSGTFSNVPLGRNSYWVSRRSMLPTKRERVWS